MKKPLKIRPENGPEIKVALDGVNGRAERFGHSLFDVIDAMIFAAQFGEIEASVGSRKASATSAGFRTTGSWEMSIRITSPTPEAEVSIGCDELLSTCVYKDSSSHADGAHGDLLRETPCSFLLGT